MSSDNMRMLTEEEKEATRQHTKSVVQQLDALERQEQKTKYANQAKEISLQTIIVNWSGPFALDDLNYCDRWNGLYLLTGKQKYERQNQIQYCGITEGLFRKRILRKEHKSHQIKPETLSVWLGAVVYPKKFKRNALELAEHCLIHFWDPPLNVNKVILPPDPVCLISQWYNCDDQPRLNRPSIFKHLPDVLWWDDERWRTGKLSVWQIG